jgi:hypothetical protein
MVRRPHCATVCKLPGATVGRVNKLRFWKADERRLDGAAGCTKHTSIYTVSPERAPSQCAGARTGGGSAGSRIALSGQPPHVRWLANTARRGARPILAAGATCPFRESIIDQTPGNRLLAGLPRVERQALLAHCDYVRLAAALPLEQPPGRLRHAYFPVDSTISVLAPAGQRRSLEIGAVGCEGLFGPDSGLEVDWFELHGWVQGAGHAWRVEAGTLAHLASRHGGLAALLQRYLHVLLVQTARSVACCRFHSLEQRLARWLLMHRDRSWSDDLLVTHDQLALMLGARRAGVTVAAGVLEERRCIKGGRGHIEVLDREELLKAACGCYFQDRQTYEHGMGVPPVQRRY